MPMKKRFLWCWRRRPLASPEVAASGALDRVRTPTGIVAWWAFAGLASNLPGPKTRAAYLVKQLHGRAKASTPKRIPADPIRDHVLSTVSPARQGRGGWGRRSLNVTPAGKVLPCHAAESIPGLEFWSVREHSLADIWANSPGLQCLPRNRLDAGAVRKLCAARDRFRRLPLPGVRAHR